MAHALFWTVGCHFHPLFGWFFPPLLQHGLQGGSSHLIKCSPVIGNRCARHLIKPALNALAPPLAVQTPHCLQKDLRGQILSLFAVAYFTIDKTIDHSQVFLIERAKRLGIYGRRRGTYLALGLYTAFCHSRSRSFAFTSSLLDISPSHQETPS